MARRRRRGAQNTGAFWTCIVLLCVLLGGLYLYGDQLPPVETWPGHIESFLDDAKAQAAPIVDQIDEKWDALTQDILGSKQPDAWDTLPQASGDELRVHSFQLGDADAHLIVIGEDSMLIDAGEKDTAQILIDRLHQLGIQQLSCVIATHPHADHIGAMAQIIEQFQPKTCYLSAQEHTTDSYFDMHDALETAGVETIIPNPGETIALGAAQISFLGPDPDKQYEQLNDSSLVLSLHYQGKTFLFAADAQSEAEADLLRSGADLTADVLKVAHHGSDTSSTQAFINAVKPKYAVICNDNPADLDPQVRERLERVGSIILCTQSGEIVFSVKDAVISVQVLSGEP